jgi:hypothetical protein
MPRWSAQSKTKLMTLYELVFLAQNQQDNPLRLMTIARWSHSFPSRTGQ